MGQVRNIYAFTQCVAVTINLLLIKTPPHACGKFKFGPA